MKPLEKLQASLVKSAGNPLPGVFGTQKPSLVGSAQQLWDRAKSSLTGKAEPQKDTQLLPPAPTAGGYSDAQPAKNWAQQAVKMQVTGHPFFQAQNYQPRGAGRGVPFVYEHDAGDASGWRTPLNQVPPGGLNRQVMDRDLRERLAELPSGAEYYSSKSKPSQYQFPENGGSGKVFISAGQHPASTATHEHEHSLNVPHLPTQMEPESNLTDKYFGPDPDAKMFTHSLLETPAVMAETVSKLRGMEANNPGHARGLSFGVPGYNRSSGEFVRRQGSKYMYGRDPDTDAKIAPQRSMTDLLSTREGQQWLEHMGKRK